MCFVFNSKIHKSEDNSTEYKLFDLRKSNENTKTLEKTIISMLNKEENFQID